MSGCASSGPQQPNLTPLQIQLMQNKVFNVDLRTTFDATVTVMQNLGYIIQDANFNSGIITAKSTQTANFWVIQNIQKLLRLSNLIDNQIKTRV